MKQRYERNTPLLTGKMNKDKKKTDAVGRWPIVPANNAVSCNRHRRLFGRILRMAAGRILTTAVGRDHRPGGWFTHPSMAAAFPRYHRT